MGQSLARNIANKGFSISVFNIETDVTKACCQKYPLLHGYENIADFVDSLEKQMCIRDRGKTMFAEIMYRYAKEHGVLGEDAKFIVFNCAEYADNPQLLLGQLFG